MKWGELIGQAVGKLAGNLNTQKLHRVPGL